MLKRTASNHKALTKKAVTQSVIAGLGFVLASCANDPQPAVKSGTGATSNSSNSQLEETSNAIGTHISFHYSDYFTLTHPRSDTSCAGDVKNYYKAFDYQIPNGSIDPTDTSGYVAATGPTGPRAFSTDDGDSTMTARPQFIKNISVDITDANSPISSNQAFACSLGTSSSAPPPSNCATFDYGAVGGIPSTLGGTLVLIGGINGTNYGIASPDGSDSTVAPRGHSLSCGPSRNTTWTAATSCPTSMYALGIDTLPPSAATGDADSLAPGLTEQPDESISTWGNLGNVTGYSGPEGSAGASVTYTKELQRILLFGGAAPMAGMAPTGVGSDTSDTWTYDIKEQKWTKLQTLPSDSALATMNDSLNSSTHYQLSKSAGGRALFGYAALPYSSIRNMSTDGLVGTAAGKAVVDTTDRIAVVGGYAATTEESYTTRKFNPTFGPEYVDLYSTSGPAAALGASEPVQYLDSFHTQLMNNNLGSNAVDGDNSQLKGTFGYAGATASAFNNFGMTALISGGVGNLAGYLLTAGGFPNLLSSDTVTPAAPNAGGRMYFSGRRNDNISSAANLAAVPNAIVNTSGVATRQTPLDWDEFTEAGGRTVPWYTGGSLLQGFDLDQNEVVWLGGSNCKDYLTKASLAGCTFANPGRYFRLGAGPFAGNTNIPAEIALVGASPAFAGMATARGLDSAGNVIVVAWGGTNAPGESKNSTVYLLWDNGGAPTWATASNSTSGPAALTNAAMVFSHVTRKFYLFGGYKATKDSNGIVTSSNVNDTWELSITRSAGPVYSATWKKLNTSGGLTCYPADCPVARRSHRMVEVNYNNTDPTEEPVCNVATAPCSFGIFMEGGSADGYEVLGDRWMLDPTANEGLGHWQKVDGFPPRHAAAMASVSYNVNNQANAIHRSVLFGGQSGLHSPATAISGNFFIPPTFGDTYLYDFTSNTWMRPKLLGKGYNGAAVPGGLTEFEKRQVYMINGGSIMRQRTLGGVLLADSSIAELSPPPLAGAIMVTRTFSGPLKDSTTPVSELKIPEVFLFGGRKKDGTYNTLDAVYKFCAGSTGERIPDGATDDASCDAFDPTDPTDNPNSPSPSSDAIGRWIRKTPVNPDPAAPSGANYDVTTNTIASYMGAAVYDPMQDKIVMFGGLTSTTAVTNTAGRAAGSTIYEFTPPSKVDTNNDYLYSGYWRKMPACAYTGSTTPTGRYGHSMGYDLLNRQIVVVGGYDADGEQLTQTLTSRGTDYTVPEVWTARRIEQAGVVSDTDGTEIPTTGNTFPCYYWKQKTVFGNSPEVESQAPPSGGISHAASIFIPSTGYNTGFYSMFDDACPKAGPLAINDPEVSKLLAGGVYIDLDRSALKTGENLLLNLTYIPLGTTNTKPNGSAYKDNESAVIKVHLMSTGESLGTIRSQLQPRHLAYAPTDDTNAYVVQTLSVLAPPTGSVRQDQVILPISIDRSIDRIRIERYSGSAILIDAGIYRMGAK